MSTHDLLSEDDFFSEINNEKEQEPESPRESFPEDDLFQGMPQKEEEQLEEIEELPLPGLESLEEAPQDFSEDIKDELELDQVEEAVVERPKTAEEKAPEEYYESKQEGISYKPILIGAVIVAVIAAAFFVIKIFVFDSKEAKQVVEQPETKQVLTEAGPSPEEIKRAAYFRSLTAETKESLTSISNIAAIAGKGNKVSSVYLYGDECMVEVFCKNRSELAKLNMNFKQNNQTHKMEIISSRVRPGEPGGIVGLFQLTKSAGGSNSEGPEVGNPFKTQADAANWLNSIVQNNSLSLKKSKTKPIGRENDFDVLELEANINGGVSNCLKFINDIASSSKNIKIHKLNLTAVDQKTFSAKKYELRMILKIFV